MNTISKIALLALVAGAACSENTIAPTTDAAQKPTTAVGNGSTQDITPYDTIRFAITIDPSRTTYYYLGAGNSLTFPAHSLCDVSSSYGSTEWDKPCTQAVWPVTVNVKAWQDKSGHVQVDFDKHLRFVPSTNPANWVVITFADLQASLNPFFNILYCPQTTGSCVNEALSDPTLLTIRDPLSGKVTRRIKHFSGYNVAAGDEIDPALSTMLDGSAFSISTDDLSIDDLEGLLSAHPELTTGQAESLLTNIRFARKFSGYILASG